MKAKPAPAVSTLRLAPVLDLTAAAPLKSELLALRGAPLDLDASAVDRVGGLCLQVLLAADAAWAADGHTLKMTGPSQALREAFLNLGAAQMADCLIREN